MGVLAGRLRILTRTDEPLGAWTQSCHHSDGLRASQSEARGEGSAVGFMSRETGMWVVAGK